MILACYAGTGKTTASKLRMDTLDFLLAPYKYGLSSNEGDTHDEHEEDKATEHDYFDLRYPVKYTDALIDLMDQYSYILIPTDPQVLDRLDKKGIPYLIILPAFERPGMKQVYEERYKKRGNNSRFLSIFIGQWGHWMKSLSSRDKPYVTLAADEYVADILDRLT